MKRKEFVENFLNAFAKDIPKETLKSRFIGWGRHRCLWNLFAEPLVPCVRGEEAKKLYDKADKGEAMEISEEIFHGTLLQRMRTVVLKARAHIFVIRNKKQGVK